MPRRPDPLTMMAANVEACPALDTLLRIARYAAEGGAVREWTTPLCHATAWEVNFARDVWEKSRRWMLSEAQRNLITRIVNGLSERAGRRNAEVAAAMPVPTGRREITGVVVSIKERSTYLGYGRSRTTLKMLVQCDGYKLWGSVPAALSEQVQKGDEVRFVATVTEKERGFGFFTRPVGGSCVAPVAMA